MQDNMLIPFPLQAAERHFNPLYGESRERFIRMGLIDMEEAVLCDNIAAFCAPVAATLYDNLLECGEDVLGINETLSALFFREETTGMYLYLCVLYGQMGEVIPEPLQWLSGHKHALIVFCEMLVNRMTDYLHEDGFLCEDDEDGESPNVIPFPASAPADAGQI